MFTCETIVFQAVGRLLKRGTDGGGGGEVVVVAGIHPRMHNVPAHLQPIHLAVRGPP